MKPADGRIYDRIIEAESCPASTATDPALDNEKLVPLVEAFGQAETSGDTVTATRLRGEIEQILRDEVHRRHRMPNGSSIHPTSIGPSSESASIGIDGYKQVSMATSK